MIGLSKADRTQCFAQLVVYLCFGKMMLESGQEAAPYKPGALTFIPEGQAASAERGGLIYVRNYLMKDILRIRLQHMTDALVYFISGYSKR